MRAWIYARWSLLKEDAGEGPVPHVVMVALMVAVAVAVTVGLGAVAMQWVNSIDPPP